MGGDPKTRTIVAEPVEATEERDEREVFLRDGRRLVISESGADQLVEIRNAGGMLELRVVLTETGPVLQMEAVKLQLKATEAIEIESPRVAITGTEQLAIHGGHVKIEGEHDVDVEAHGDVHVVGTKIWLN